MSGTIFQEIKVGLRELYLGEAPPWLVGFSGGKDSTMLASLIFDVILSIPAEQRKKPISVLCTDTRVEVPAITDMVEGTLDRMRKCSHQHNLTIDANLLKPTIEESFWVSIIGRAYPLLNRSFRWCTQRMKIDPVNAFVKQHLGNWGEVILHSWTVLRLTTHSALGYLSCGISSPSDQPKGLRRGFAFKGSETCLLSPALNAPSRL